MKVQVQETLSCKGAAAQAHLSQTQRTGSHHSTRYELAALIILRALARYSLCVLLALILCCGVWREPVRCVCEK